MGILEQRKFQTVKKPKNRHQVDNVCNYILQHEKKDFEKGDHRPSVKHIYFDAYSVIFGSEAALKMLAAAKRNWK